jgi:hypothetical protein
MLLYPNEGFLEQHSSATVREKDKIRVQNDDFAGNRKSQDKFIILGAICRKLQALV